MQRKILIFDDEQDNLSKIYIHLLGEEYKVEATMDAEEIVPRALRIQPDVVLLNSDVPGFNGTEVCAVIKRGIKVPVVLMLEKTSSSTIVIDSCSADEIIYKPIDVKELIVVIQRLIAMQ